MAEMSKYWRKPNPHDGSNMMKGIYKDVPATRLFDNLWFVGNDMFGAYVLKSSEGLILLDCMEVGMFDYLDGKIREAGLDPADVKAILITHGHGDHYGDANIFRDKYGCKLYMTETDEKFALDPSNAGPGRKPLQYKMDGYLVPGEDFVLGDTHVEIYDTSGHTPGTASFIFTVYDCGKALPFMMWGGTGPNREPALIRKQIETVRYFDRVCLERGVVGEVGNHPFTDNLVEKIEVIRNIVDGVPHPLVIGYEGIHSMMLMYQGIYEQTLEKRAKGDLSNNFGIMPGAN